MGVFPGMATGASSMRNASDQIQVIGNNLANAGTPGFKRSVARTSESISFNLPSIGSNATGQVNQIGRGANRPTVQKVLTQGTAQRTGLPLDVSIEGTGFFVLKDALTNQLVYARDGSFALDNNWTLIHKGTGLLVQAFWVDAAGLVNTTLGDVVLGQGASLGQATTQIELIGNLDASVSALGAAPTHTSTTSKRDEFIVQTGLNDQIEFEVGASGLLTASLTTDGGLTTGTPVTGAALAVALKTALETVNPSGDTYNVSYNQTTDKFQINNRAENVNNIQFRHNNAASTASGLLGFLAVDSGTIRTGADEFSNLGVAFNIITGVNDTMDIVFTGTGDVLVDGITQSITVAPGNFTGNGLAFKIQQQLTALSSSLRASKVTYNAQSGNFTFSGPRSGGAHTINQPSNLATPTVAVGGTSVAVSATGSLNSTVGINSATGTTAGSGFFDAAKPFDSSTANFQVDILDGLGGNHSANLFFRKMGENTWEWHAALKGEEITGPTANGAFEEVASGVLQFTSTGLLDIETVQAGTGLFSFDPDLAGGATPPSDQVVNFIFGASITTDGGTGDDGFTQFGIASFDSKAASGALKISQDDPVSVTLIRPDGIKTASSTASRSIRRGIFSPGSRTGRPSSSADWPWPCSRRRSSSPHRGKTFSSRQPGRELRLSPLPNWAAPGRSSPNPSNPPIRISPRNSTSSSWRSRFSRRTPGWSPPRTRY